MYGGDYFYLLLDYEKKYQVEATGAIGGSYARAL